MRVAGVDYEVNWRAFDRSATMFFPCLDPKVARRELRAEMRRLGFKVLYKNAIELGVRGVRVWRL